MIYRSFFIARREPPPLLQSVDQPLHPVACPVERAVERSRAPLIGPARDRDADAPPPQLGPDLAATVPRVAHDAPRPQPWTPPPRSFDRPLRHQTLEGGRLMALPWREHEGDGLAVALDADMDFGTEAALAPTEGFRFWVPFFAPAACW